MSTEQSEIITQIRDLIRERDELKRAIRILNIAFDLACESLAERDDQKRDFKWWQGAVWTDAEDIVELNG